MVIGLMMGSLALVVAQDVQREPQFPGAAGESLSLPDTWASVAGFEAQSGSDGWCVLPSDAEQGAALVRWQVAGNSVQESMRWPLPEACTGLALDAQVVMLLGETALWSLPRDAGAQARPRREIDLPEGFYGELWHSPSGARGLGNWLLLGEQGLFSLQRGARDWRELGREYAGISAVLESERGGLFLLAGDGPVQILPGAELFPAPAFKPASERARGVQLLTEAWPEGLRGGQLWLHPKQAVLRKYEVILRGTRALSLGDAPWLELEDEPQSPTRVHLSRDGAALFLLLRDGRAWLRRRPEARPVEAGGSVVILADLDSSHVLRRRAAQAWFADTRAGLERLDALRPAVASEQLRFSEAPGMNFRPWMGALGTDLGRLHTVWALDAWRVASDPRLAARARLLLELAAANVDPGMRMAAVDALATWPGELNDPDQLLLLAEDAHPGVRQSAARAIAMRGLEEGAVALVKAFGLEGDPGAAAQMAGALRSLGGWAAIAEGTTQLVMEADRTRLWKLFDGVRDKRAIEPLVWTLGDGSVNFRVRAEAARVLGGLGKVSSDQVRGALMRAAEGDQAPLVRETAAAALKVLDAKLQNRD